MIRILLALAVIAVILYSNPLLKFNSAKLDEKKRTTVEKQIDEIQEQVDYAKKMTQKQMEGIE